MFKISRLSNNAVVILKNSIIAALFFLIYHIVLSPITAYLDGSYLAWLRGPLCEEIFKYGFAYYFLKNFTPQIQALVAGIGVGISETAINTTVVFEDMYSDLALSFQELGPIELNFWIAFAIFLKLIFNCVAHYLFVLIGMKVFKEKIFAALSLSIIIHLMVNSIILS